MVLLNPDGTLRVILKRSLWSIVSSVDMILPKLCMFAVPLLLFKSELCTVMRTDKQPSEADWPGPPSRTQRYAIGAHGLPLILGQNVSAPSPSGVEC